MLIKAIEKVTRETAEQRERVAICAERILIMEEQVGMMEHNETYKNSVYLEKDELFQDSKVLMARAEDNDVSRHSYKNLNPASTTSSLARIEMAS